MITTLIAALAVAASAAIDVPYLPQTEALCGGAATAMVFRYWGDAHADVQEFATLVDRRAGGIANGALTDAVEARGWRVGHVAGTLQALRDHISNRQPVIVLLADRSPVFHYVVVTGWAPDAIVVHDPSWGPSRTIATGEFERLWKAADFWSLVILPPVAGTVTRAEQAPPLQLNAPTDQAEQARPLPNGTADVPDGWGRRWPAQDSPRPTSCDIRLDAALSRIRTEGLGTADALLDEVRAACPQDPRPVHELAGVRFAEKRWADASALAGAALAIDPGDRYAIDLLGSSLFMQDDYVGALTAWNRIGKPRVNLVRIDGLHHARFQTVADALGIRANQLLTADAFERARRRLADLPDASMTRLALRPERDGFATVDVVIAERDAIPRGVAAWSSTAARAAIDREATVAVPGFTGQGDVWFADWRWWTNRPAFTLGFNAPGVGALPGVWRVEGGWQSDTFAVTSLGASAQVVRESRAHAALSLSDWLTGSLRYSATAGFDSWNGVTKAVATGGSLEQRLLGDRVALSGNFTRWTPVTAGAAFGAVGVMATARSSTEAEGWVVTGTIGAQRVSNAAPLDLWPGAGTGHAREPLLRAHPLLTDGVVGVNDSSVFGRTLTFGGAEVQRWLDRPTLARVAIAGFMDVARATRRAAELDGPAQVDLGVGLRMRMPGSAGMLRIDVAHGVRDGANAFTVGIMR